jgi:hypothetical protein
MDSLQAILPKVLRKRGLHRQVDASLVTFEAQRWLQSALPDLSTAFSVASLSHATLSIHCTHSIAAQECQPLLPQLKAFLLRQCKGIPIEEIRLIRALKRAE